MNNHNNVNSQKKPQMCDASTQPNKSQETQTDISGSKDDLLVVDERLAKLMLGTISLIQSNKFKSKSEIECGMRDIFKNAFGHDWIGAMSKKSDKASGIQSNSSGNRSHDEGKSRSRSGESKGKEVSTKQSEVGELMGPPKCSDPFSW